MKKIFIVLAVILLGAASWYVIFLKDRLQVQIVAPDGDVRGSIYTLQALYKAGGEAINVEIDERMLTDELELEHRLPREWPWTLQEMRVEIRNPLFRPTVLTLPGNPHWLSQKVILEPLRWTAPGKKIWVEHSEQTSADALEHLRWVRNDYLERPERLLVNEAMIKYRQLLGGLAYAGGGKQGEWEQVRQQTIGEWKQIDRQLEARYEKPCPEGYDARATGYPCGRIPVQFLPPRQVKGEAGANAAKTQRVYLPAESAPAADPGKKWRGQGQLEFAQADLVRGFNLNQDPLSVAPAAVTSAMWPSAAAGCPEPGMSYTAALVPGILILFEIDGTFYRYHGVEGAAPFYCPQDRAQNGLSATEAKQFRERLNQ